LSTPPNTHDAVVNLKLYRLVAYFQGEWLSAANPAKIELWNHYNHTGPRTSNHCEGYNNSLSFKFDRTHTRLSVFLVQLQSWHHSIQVRARQVQRGDNPNPRAQQYIDNDARIRAAEQAFVNNWALFGSNPMALNHEIRQYLDYVEHFIGNH
jgi:hypothetical protein